jgi:hypothetical protein
MRARASWSANSTSIRSFISLAALLVKVTARMLSGSVLVGEDQVGNAEGEGAGFTGPGPGHHQQGTTEMLDRLTLSWVEEVEEIRH